jgi:hypothetical protein
MKKKSNKILKQQIIGFAVDHLAEAIYDIEWSEEEKKKIKSIINKLENLIGEIKK